jgi:chromosome segregation ATPase
MEIQSVYTIVITIITVLGSTSAWKYYEKRAAIKEKNIGLYKDDCRERIAKLEILLEKSSHEKEELRSRILILTEDVAKLGVKVEYLEEDNENLREKLSFFDKDKSYTKRRKTPPTV